MRGRLSRLLMLVLISICAIGAAGCGSKPPRDALFQKLIVVSADNYDTHNLLGADETLDLETAANSLVSEGFRPDFAELPYATYQKCGAFTVPIKGSDVRFQAYDDAALHRHADLFHWDAYTVIMYVSANCKVTGVLGAKVRPNTL